MVVEKDALIETGTTDSEGKLKFQADLPHGKFYVKELEKKPGYLDNEEIYHFDAGYTDSSKEVIELSCEILNQLLSQSLQKQTLPEDRRLREQNFKS